eukprot:221102-Amphidinium_carterae.2
MRQQSRGTISCTQGQTRTIHSTFGGCVQCYSADISLGVEVDNATDIGQQWDNVDAAVPSISDGQRTSQLSSTPHSQDSGPRTFRTSHSIAAALRPDNRHMADHRLDKV